MVMAMATVSAAAAAAAAVIAAVMMEEQPCGPRYTGHTKQLCHDMQSLSGRRSAAPGHGSSAEVASYGWLRAQRSLTRARLQPQKRRTHALQAARLRSPPRPQCSPLQARCLRNKCQMSCSAGCVATVAMAFSTDRARLPIAAPATSRIAATLTQSLAAWRAR